MYSNNNDCAHVYKIAYKWAYNHGNDAYENHPFAWHLKTFLLFFYSFFEIFIKTVIDIVIDMFFHRAVRFFITVQK